LGTPMRRHQLFRGLSAIVTLLFTATLLSFANQVVCQFFVNPNVPTRGASTRQHGTSYYIQHHQAGTWDSYRVCREYEEPTMGGSFVWSPPESDRLFDHDKRSDSPFTDLPTSPAIDLGPIPLAFKPIQRSTQPDDLESTWIPPALDSIERHHEWDTWEVHVGWPVRTVSIVYSTTTNDGKLLPLNGFNTGYTNKWNVPIVFVPRTTVVSLLSYVICVSLAYGLAIAIRKLLRRKDCLNTCRACGYSLDGLQGSFCPECGLNDVQLTAQPVPSPECSS
jgi:hypothetical protein